MASKWSGGVLLYSKILLIEMGPVTVPAMTATMQYAEGGGAQSDRLYETQRRLADFVAWQKGEAGEGTGSAVRRELDRLVNSGWTLVEIGSRVDRSTSTLSSIRSGEIKNPPETLLNALRRMKSKQS